MRISKLIWLNAVADKLVQKHNVETYEVEEVFSNKPRFRYVQKGNRRGEDVYGDWSNRRRPIFDHPFYLQKRWKWADLERKGHGSVGA